MSIKDEILRIKSNISNAYAKLEEKGATMPTDRNSNNLATTISNISVGGGNSSQIIDGTITEVTNATLSGVETIRPNAFSGMSITSVSVPSNVSTIGDSAFANNSISTLTLAEGVTTIGDSAFANNEIVELAMPNTLTSTGANSFENNNMTTITIPSNVTNIGDNAFAGCTSLTEVIVESKTPPTVTSTSFPSNVTTIKVPYGAYETYLEEWSAYADKIVRLPAIPSTIMVIVDNYLGEKVSGASVTITGNGLTFTGTTDEQGVFTQGDLQPATYTISVADYEGYKTPKSQEVIVTEGSSNMANVTYLEKPQFILFSEATPEEISQISAEISANNMTSAEVAEAYHWNIGDTTDITLTTGEKIQMRIIGFNHDDLSDGTGKAGITLEMTHTLVTIYPMNNENTNKGGYAGSVMKTRTLPTIKDTIPQRWQNVIKFVDKNSANGGSENYTETLTLSEDIFLLSMIEITDNYNLAKDGANEGQKYEYYQIHNTTDDRIKYKDTDADGVVDTQQAWWLRSSRINYTSQFGIAYGDVNSASATGSKGVSFAFCV